MVFAALPFGFINPVNAVWHGNSVISKLGYFHHIVCADLSGSKFRNLLLDDGYGRFGRGDAPASVSTWYNIAGLGVLSVIAMILPDRIQSISHSVLINLVILRVIGSALQIVMTTAYRYSGAVVMTSMRFVKMPI